MVLLICLGIFNPYYFIVRLKTKTLLSIQGNHFDMIKDMDSMLEDNEKKEGHTFINLLLSLKWEYFFLDFLS